MKIEAADTHVEDWVLTCCECGQPAVALIETHPVAECEDNPNATLTCLMCGDCMSAELAAIQSMLFQIFLGLMADECCCGRGLVSLSDVIIRMCPLTIWPGDE